MAKQPNIPRHPTNPVGQTQRLKKVRKAYRADIAEAQEMALREVADWPVVKHNRGVFTNAWYEYKVDLNVLTSLVDRILKVLGRGRAAEEMRKAAEAAYKEGTAKAVQNLAGLIDDYTRSVTQRLGESPILRRAALAGARAFEQMQGFAGDTAADLSRVLFNAVETGQNPRDTARTLRERFSVSKTRAERIARTEVTGALRRGRWDEARDAQENFGEEVRLIHYSALIAGRTRRSHAKRHGKIVTVEEEAAWYASDGNAINCLCSQTEVVVDENGEPVFGKKLIERLKTQRDRFLSGAMFRGE